MQTIDLPVGGMRCTSCVDTIESGLRRVPGVQTASVDLAAAQATITYDPAIARVNQLIQAIEDAGYEVKAAHTTGRSSGMANQAGPIQTLKQVLKMAACCAGPILGLALLVPLAGTLGVGVSSAVSFLLVLACPLSMLFMVYFMMRGQKAERQGQGQAEGQPRPQMSPVETTVAMGEGDGQPEARLPSAVSGSTMPSPKSFRP
jgi:copper chaperone CopZ